MGYFDYSNPYEWLEAKAYEMCGEEEEVEYREEEKIEKTERKEKKKREKPQEERIGIDVPVWGKEPKEKKEKQSQPIDENDEDDWVITF